MHRIRLSSRYPVILSVVDCHGGVCRQKERQRNGTQPKTAAIFRVMGTGDGRREYGDGVWVRGRQQSYTRTLPPASRDSGGWVDGAGGGEYRGSVGDERFSGKRRKQLFVGVSDESRCPRLLPAAAARHVAYPCLERSAAARARRQNSVPGTETRVGTDRSTRRRSHRVLLLATDTSTDHRYSARIMQFNITVRHYAS